MKLHNVFIVGTLTLLLFTGYDNEPNEKMILNKETESEKELNSNELLYEWFAIKKGKINYFSGTNEHRHERLLVGATYEQETEIGDIAISIKEDRLDKENVEYTIFNKIDNGEVQQVLRFEGDKELYPSTYGIVPNRTIYKFNTNESMTWKETISIKNKEYLIQSKILEETDKRIKIRSTIDGIEEYENNTYEEVYIIEKGMGVIYLSFNLPLNNNSEQYYSNFEFQYAGEQNKLIENKS